MIYLAGALVISVVLNVILTWYAYKMLAKLLYTSDNLGDLYVVFRLYEDFTTALYKMTTFHGEPIIEELIGRTKIVREELERFQEIYEITTDLATLEEDLSEDDTTD